MFALRTQFRAISSVARVVPTSRVTAFRQAPAQLRLRTYAAASGLSKEQIETRVMDVVKSFEKVDGSKITATSSFANDLGLDSLDAVEVVMAVEEEFAIEIPDAEADQITTIQQAIDYISKTPEAH